MRHLVIVLDGKLTNITDPLGARLVLGTLEFLEERIVGFLQDRIESRKTIIKKISTLNPDIIWISIQPSAIEIEKFIHEIMGQTNSPIVLGNIGVRSLSLKDFKRKNIFIVHGQGEDAVFSLVKYFKQADQNDHQLSLINNLVWTSKKNQVIYNKQKPSLLSKKIVPSDFLLKEAIERQEIITARSSSGCSGCCIFCSVKSINNQQSWDYYPYDILYQWLQKIVLSGGKNITIHLTDDNLANNIKHLYNVANIFSDINKKYKANLAFNLSARADSLANNKDYKQSVKKRQNIWKHAVQSGLKTIFLGLESGSDTQLKRLGKKTMAKQNYQAINFTSGLGIEIDIGFIVFDPLMKKDQWKGEMLDNIKLAKRCNSTSELPSTWLAPLRIYENTSCHKILTKKNLLKHKIKWSEEYTCKYECREVYDFMLNLGPVICEGQNDYFKFKKEFKIAKRFPTAIVKSFTDLGKDLFTTEIHFVEQILKANNTEDIQIIRLEFISSTCKIMSDLICLCKSYKKHKQITQMVKKLENARQTLEDWGCNKWIKGTSCYL